MNRSLFSSSSTLLGAGLRSAVAPKAFATTPAALAMPRRTLICPVPAGKRKYPVKKQMLVKEYKYTLLNSPALVVARAPNMSEKEWGALRLALKAHRVGVKSIANGTFSVAARNHGVESARLAPDLTGQNAAFYALPAPAKAAKPAPSGFLRYPKSQSVEPATVADILAAVTKFKKVQITGAVLNGTYYAPDAVQHFSTLPNMGQLRAELVAVLGAPAQRIASILGQNQSSLAALLGQRVKDMEAAAGAGAAQPSA
ncbi:hypothetical protein H9P43_003429 [Blastocladiella emersonii ATCC 22665]|nr:hypothetical protein H9P43_003429 [Blastocladiella emersonii ATCC 22665]